MKSPIYLGLLFIACISCKKESGPIPNPGTANYRVSRMTINDGNHTTSATFDYNTDGTVKKVIGGEFVMDISYHEDKTVKRINKVYNNNSFIVAADYSYSEGKISREERHESVPPDLSYMISYNYEWNANNTISKLTYLSSNSNPTYVANFNYAANNNPGSIVSTAGQVTEFSYSSREFKLFPGNEFLYPWLDLFLTHEYMYFVPFSRELTRVKRNTPGGTSNWQIDLSYKYDPHGNVSKLTWTYNQPVQQNPLTTVYTFEYTSL